MCVRLITSPAKSYDNISMLYRLAFLFNTIGPHGFACLFSICSAPTPLKKCKFRIEKNWARRPIGPLGKNCTEKPGVGFPISVSGFKFQVASCKFQMQVPAPPNYPKTTVHVCFAEIGVAWRCCVEWRDLACWVSDRVNEGGSK